MHSLSWKNLPALALVQDIKLKADWDHLNAQRGNLPFLSSDAVALALQSFGEGNERLLMGQEGGHTTAMLLVSKVGPLRWQTFQPAQMPLGAWVADAQLQLDEIAQSALHSGQLEFCLSLSITQVDPLFAPMGTDSSVNRHDPYIDTAWVEIAGSFEDYWAARGKNLRQNMRKQRNKLQTDGVSIAMRVVNDPNELGDAISRYGELESRSWKAQEGTAIRADNDQGRFYTALFTAAAEKGEAVVYEYLFDGKAVASNLCLRRDGTMVILKTTYDESIKTFSPAFMLNEELIQALFAEQQIQRLEYYGRVMEWHTRWTDKQRTLYHLTTFRHPLIKQLVQYLKGRRTPLTAA